MINRLLYSLVFSNEWGRQMRFISGPRQSGKTTLARLKLKNENSSEMYYLWDLRSVRNRYKSNELFFTSDRIPEKNKIWLCFDEIHKMPKWKNILKGLYDVSYTNYQFIITGSAKLDIFRKSGDSLSGRYFTFHLLPLSLAELTGQIKNIIPENDANLYIQNKLDNNHYGQSEMLQLLEYSGFPEPFQKQSVRFFRKWSNDYLDTVIKEDIGQLTKIIDREYLYDLYQLFPEMVGNPISESSIASHLEVSPPTIKNYIKKLEDFYLAFRIFPYSKNIKRAILKAAKCYLYNWSQIENEASRFENYVAVELKTRTSLWSDATGISHSLFYIRNKAKQETDFLILKNKKPWLLIEVKLKDAPLSRHHFITQNSLGNIPLVQLCKQDNIGMLQNSNTYRISASRFFSSV